LTLVRRDGLLSWRDAAAGVLAALRFYSRLPLPVLAFERSPFAAPDIGRLAPFAPVAGSVIGACGALVLALAQRLSLPPLPSAGLALATLVLVGGAFHEDGLADVADGFGGGSTRARKLEIMRDSRIGAYGATALTLSLILRVGALASLAAQGTWLCAAAMILAGAVSRAAGLLPMVLLEPARADGASAGVGHLADGAFLKGGLVALTIAVVCGLLATGLGRALTGFFCASAAALAVTVIARRQVAGQTGDVAGAAQQLAEIACLCGLLIGARAD
jgi:adenosylcobinamide-GDP ribazoletransferase